MKIDDKLIEKNTERVYKLIGMMPKPRKTQVEEMLSGAFGTAYFTAPASSREDYHNAWPGGLVDHSLRLLKHLVKLADVMCPGKFTKDKLAFVALFHDLGKAGDGENEFYVLTELDWKKKKGEVYETNKKCLYMPSAERGLFVLQKFGINIDHDEYVAIRLNDGQYVDNNREWRLKEPDLALLVHWADLWAMREEKMLRNSGEKTE